MSQTSRQYETKEPLVFSGINNTKPITKDNKSPHDTKVGTFFAIIIVSGLVMLILGAVFWADAQWQLAVNCDLNKKINQSLGIYTPAEVDAFYEACKANANAELRWCQPVCIVGAIVLFTIMLPAQIWYDVVDYDHKHKK